MGTLETRESGKVPKREEQHTEDNKRKSKVGRCRQKWSKQFSRDKLTFPFPYHSLAPWTFVMWLEGSGHQLLDHYSKFFSYSIL